LQQLELLYRKVLWTYPPSGGSKHKPIRARVDDGLDYMLKDDNGGEPIRAREWICHQIAECAGLPVVEHRPILRPDGRVLFGSEFILNGGPGGDGYRILAGTLPIAEASRVFSALYAVDLFVCNCDRHANNFMVEQSSDLRIRVIDFSESPALIDSGRRSTIPGSGTNTVAAGRTLRNLYGFDHSSAGLALDRIASVTDGRMTRILADMPTDWLDNGIRNELVVWWSSPARPSHITTIRNGLTNGTLL
jgi:hypothetical protein